MEFIRSVGRGVLLAAATIGLFLLLAFAITHWPKKEKPYTGDYIKGTFQGTKEEYGTITLDGNGHSSGQYPGKYHYRAESGSMNVNLGGLFLSFEVKVEGEDVTITSTRGGIEGEWKGKMDPVQD